MVDDIPTSLTVSIFIASLLFMGSVWLIVHLSVKSWKISLGVLSGLLGWYTIVIVLGSLGFFAQDYLIAPNIIFAFIFIFFLIRYLYSLPILQRIADAIPTHWLIAVQFFRVMGYGFLVFYSLGLLPAAFAIPTGVGDIFVGLTAPIVAYIVYLRKSFSKNLGIIWNFIGIADLLLAITLGTLTYQWLLQIIPTEVPSNPIALTPLITVPVFAVPLSILLHLFSLRVLKRWN